MNSNEILEKNLQALDIASNSNFISDSIKRTSSPSFLKEFKDDLGNRSFCVSSSKGEVPAYDKEDVFKDLKEVVGKLSLHSTDITIMIGVGFGHLLKTLMDQREKDHIVLLIEPIKYFLKETLSIYDFSEQIKDGSLILAVQGKEELQNVMSILESVRVNESYNVVFEKYVNHRIEDYKEMADFALASLNALRCNKATVMSVGEILADNDINNLPYALPHRGIVEFENFYKDVPAVLVSTGPSLVKNVHYLREYKDKVVIIAVAQALRPLLAYDIIPDFITTVDFGEPNMGHLKGLMDSEVPLVCLNRTYAPLIKAYKGPKIIVSTPMHGHEKTAAGVLIDKGTLDQGGSVAHMSLSLANHLGCNPIMIIGQDLSIGETSHIPLADVAGTIEVTKNNEILWKVEDQRSKLSGDKVKHSMGELRFVKGYFNDMVTTNIGLESFITAFEALVEKYKDRKIINCTEGGADIPKTLKSSLKKCLAEHCKQEIDKQKIKPLLSEASNLLDLIEKAVSLLKVDIENLKIIAKKCNQGIYSANKMKSALDMRKGKYHKNKQLAFWSKKNFEESNEAFQKTVLNPLVSVAIYSASVKIQSHKVNVKLDKDKNLIDQKEALLTRIKRNIFILTSAKNACKNLEKSYLNTLSILEKYIETKDASIFKDLEEEIVDLSDAEKYFEKGNYAHPYVDAIKILNKDPNNQDAITIKNKAIKMREDKIKEMLDKEKQGMGTDNILSYHELLEASRKSGKNADYDNCLWCLEEANRINPNQTEVLWGLGTTYYFLKRFDEAEKYYKQLIQKEPENPKFNFEYGQLLLNKKDFPEGLKLIAKAMLAVPDYNYFFKNIGNIYFSAKMYKESIDAYEEYLKFFPLDKSAYQQLIIACTEGNEPEKLSDYSIKLKELTDSEKKDQE